VARVGATCRGDADPTPALASATAPVAIEAANAALIPNFIILFILRLLLVSKNRTSQD
jgi:hypothetical protein